MYSVDFLNNILIQLIKRWFQFINNYCYNIQLPNTEVLHSLWWKPRTSPLSPKENIKHFQKTSSFKINYVFQRKTHLSFMKQAKRNVSELTSADDGAIYRHFGYHLELASTSLVPAFCLEVHVLALFVKHACFVDAGSWNKKMWSNVSFGRNYWVKRKLEETGINVPNVGSLYNKAKFWMINWREDYCKLWKV